MIKVVTESEFAFIKLMKDLAVNRIFTQLDINQNGQFSIRVHGFYDQSSTVNVYVENNPQAALHLQGKIVVARDMQNDKHFQVIHDIDDLAKIAFNSFERHKHKNVLACLDSSWLPLFVKLKLVDDKP